MSHNYVNEPISFWRMGNFGWNFVQSSLWGEQVSFSTMMMEERTFAPLFILISIQMYST